MSTKKDYRMIDGKITPVEVGDSIQIKEPKQEQSIEDRIQALQEKDLKQRIERDSKISTLMLPLTILAWTAVVALVLNVLVILLYL